MWKETHRMGKCLSQDPEPALAYTEAHDGLIRLQMHTLLHKSTCIHGDQEQNKSNPKPERQQRKTP